MKVLLRLRLEGDRVLEIDPETIRALRIDDGDNGELMLSCTTQTCEYILVTGSPTECHKMLNKLHNILDAHIIDI
jgi:hypothetical protein